MRTCPSSVFGLGDGGAHAGQTCDAGTTTFLLTHWARDRQGTRLGVEGPVNGMTGDLNIVDLERLSLRRPEVAHDLPGGASRLVQRAEGYVARVKSSEVVFSEGEATGGLPGELLRGAP